MKLDDMGGNKPGIWVSQDGRETPYEKMNAVHLANAIKKLEREAEGKALIWWALLQNDVKNLDIDDLTVFMEKHPLNKGYKAYLSQINMHYDNMKIVLAEKNEEEKKQQEEREKEKTLDSGDGQWF